MLKPVINILFPPVCPLCEDGLCQDVPGFCPECKTRFEDARIKTAVCTICGAPFPSGAGDGHPCGECVTGKRPFERAISAFMYNGIVLEAVHRLKYQFRTSLAPPLARLLSHKALSLNISPDIIMPVPLHRKRLKERGFNQALLISRHLSKTLSATVDYLNLKRTLDTSPQVGLDHDERKENVKGAFALRRPSALKGKKVLLIDDVYTTGATIGECAKVLKKAGAKVYAMTIARA